MDRRDCIGVIDSGVGGLTTVKECRKILPNESILYFGDNANVPYGNRSEEEIYRLTKNSIDFLIGKGVKAIAIACNTISAIIPKYFSDYQVPIISIIEPTAEKIVKEKIDEVGILATKFTIESKAYNKAIGARDSKIKVYGEACPELAGIIDRGTFTYEEVKDVVYKHMENILRDKDLKNIVLGCTHYPIVENVFRDFRADINYINPAYEQVKYIEKWLEERDLRNKEANPKFEIYTSGSSENYYKMIDLLDIENPDRIYESINEKAL